MQTAKKQAETVSEQFICPDCGSTVPVEKMDISGICLACVTSQRMPRPAFERKPTAKHKHFWASSWFIMLSIVVVPTVLVIGINWGVNKSLDEQKTRAAIAEMKEQADGQLQQGNRKEASEVFARALQYTTEHRLPGDLVRTIGEIRTQKQTLDAKLAAEEQVTRTRQQQVEAAQAQVRRQGEMEQAVKVAEWESKKRRAERADSDPVIHRFLRRFPDQERSFKRLDSYDKQRIPDTLNLLLMTGEVDLDTVQYINKWIYSR